GAFTASLRSTVRRGRQAFGAKSRRRHSPQADAGGHLPRRPAGRAGPVRSRRGVRSVKNALPRTWAKNLFLRAQVAGGGRLLAFEARDFVERQLRPLEQRAGAVVVEIVAHAPAQG